MDTRAPMAERTDDLRRAMLDAVRAFRIDEAERIYTALTEEHGFDPDSDAMLPFRVTIGIFKGHLHDMLCMLNNLGEDRALGLKVVCMRMSGDPLWEGSAMHVEATSADADERASMAALLQSVRGA